MMSDKTRRGRIIGELTNILESIDRLTAGNRVELLRDGLAEADVYALRDAEAIVRRLRDEHERLDVVLAERGV